MDLDFIRIECDVTTNCAAQLSTMLHDELKNFEVHFKAAGCLTSQYACPSCHDRGECPYQNVFSQRLSSDPEIIRLHQKPPLPFAFYGNEMAGELSDDTVTVGLVVIGTAVNYAEYFHTALLKMLETTLNPIVNAEIFSFQSYTLDYQGVRYEVSSGTSFSESLVVLSGRHILHNAVLSDSVKISLKTPLRLLCNGSIIHFFDFAAFFRSQMRRCSSLCAYYGSGELNLDFVRLSECAGSVALFDDHIRYRQPQWTKRKNRAGLIGTVECSGLVEPMSALLLLGSYFNAGKGAAFGFGQHHTEAGAL